MDCFEKLKTWINYENNMDFKKEPLEDYYEIGTEIGRYALDAGVEFSHHWKNSLEPCY